MDIPGGLPGALDIYYHEIEQTVSEFDNSPLTKKEAYHLMKQTFYVLSALAEAINNQ